MKKVLMILLAAVLLLSLPGFASAEPTVINNVSADNDATTTVKLDLENNYKVTIPSEINFQGSQISNNPDVTALKYTANAEVKVEITLLPANYNITVNVSSSNYDSSFRPAGITNYGDIGAWNLTSGSGSSLHYVISIGSSHLGVDDLTSDKTQYVIPTSVSDNFIGNGATIVDSPVGVTVPFHVALVDVPTKVESYTDTLSFIVDLKEVV